MQHRSGTTIFFLLEDASRFGDLSFYGQNRQRRQPSIANIS
jgi:hypothetical protein